MTHPSPSGPPAGLSPLEASDPRAIPPYRIHGRLGAGGMGVVYGATDPSGAWLAIKVVRSEHAADPEFRARFAREIGLVRRVRARCIVPVLAFDTDAAQPWYATTYVPGPTLGQRVRGEGALSAERTRVVAAGMAEAIAAIHAAGVVHRDLKPANVILAPDGPKVLDFGIARALDETGLTQTGALIGSPGWMSPERFRGEFGPEDDVFAWGAMVAFAATGRPPFGTGGAETLMYRVLHEDPDLSGVPAELAGPVAEALAKEAARRPTATALLHRIAELDRATGDDDATLIGAVIQHHWRAPTGPSRPAPPPANGRSATPPGGQPAAPPVREPVPSPATPPPWPGPARPAPPATGSPADAHRGRRFALALGAGATTVVLLLGGVAVGAWYLTRGTSEEVDSEPPASQVIADPGTLGGVVTGAGSAYVAPVLERWGAEYTSSLQPDVQIDYQAIGTGAGIAAFFDEEVDFASFDLAPGGLAGAVGGEPASPPRGCPTTQIPVLAGAVAIVLNDPALDGVALDADALAGIFEGETTSFADPALATLNPDVELPDTTIVPVRHDDAAATAHVFTRYLHAESTTWGAETETFGPGGTGGESDWDPGTVAAAGDEGVAATVEREPGGIGFVNHGLAVELDLPTAAVVNADGTAVAPTIESTTAAAEQAEAHDDDTLELSGIGGDGYPIVRVNGILAYECGYDEGTAAILRDVWTLAVRDDEADAIATELGYAPLGPGLRDEALERIARVNAEDE